MANNVLWSANNLYLNIGEQLIFNRTSFAVHENERVAVVGRNGCGKSTLLKIMTNVMPPPQDAIIALNKTNSFQPKRKVQQNKSCLINCMRYPKSKNHQSVNSYQACR